jgi:hypothetical protein
MKVLIGCEESQEVCKAFRARGHEAYSCDLQPCSGGHPEWHFQQDIFEVIKMKDWDLGIFFPPCTYLTVTGNSWFNVDKYGQKAIDRYFNRLKGLEFFMRLYFCGIPKLSLENPIGFVSTAFRKPDQIIQPYYFGDAERKSTCLWLKNLPPLRYALTDNLFMRQTAVTPELAYYKSGKADSKWHYDTLGLPPDERAKLRSKTFPGIAAAMAEQWGSI